jgi:hypothetical protein
MVSPWKRYAIVQRKFQSRLGFEEFSFDVLGVSQRGVPPKKLSRFRANAINSLRLVLKSPLRSP